LGAYTKTVILGASVAGSATALSLLSNPDGEVVLIDRKLKGRVSRCAGGISLYMLSKTGLKHIPSDLIQSEIRSVRIYGPRLETSWGFQFSTPYGYVLHRARLEEWLIRQAERLGAQLCEWNVPSVEALRDRFKYDYLVGADGLPSTVRTYLGLAPPEPSDIHLGIQYETVWRDYPLGEVRLYLGELAPQGYAWVFPAEPGRAKVGLGIPLSVKANVGGLLKKFSVSIDAPQSSPPIARLIPTAPPMKTCVYGNIALVGDAALQCDPATGGGIANALICGNLLGQALALPPVISMGIDEPLVLNPLALYDVWWKHHVGRRNRLRYRLKQLLHSLKQRDLDRLLQALQGFKPQTPNVGRELARGVLHVLLREPRLLLKP